MKRAAFLANLGVLRISLRSVLSQTSSLRSRVGVGVGLCVVRPLVWFFQSRFPCDSIRRVSSVCADGLKCSRKFGFAAMLSVSISTSLPLLPRVCLQPITSFVNLSASSFPRSVCLDCVKTNRESLRQQTCRARHV